MNDKFLCVTRKELFYTAVMVGISQLVNVEYEYPIDDAEFNAELEDVRRSLRKKKLFHESIKDGSTINFGLTACASFCEEPDSCKVVEGNGYYATIYGVKGRYMLMERRADDVLAMGFFIKKENLDRYVRDKLSEGEGAIEDERP